MTVAMIKNCQYIKIKREKEVMKTTGIVRPIDELGRIVIPKEMRKIFNIKEKDNMEILVEQDKIILKKYEPTCTFCGGTDGLVFYENRNICSKCIEKMQKLQLK